MTETIGNLHYEDEGVLPEIDALYAAIKDKLKRHPATTMGKNEHGAPFLQHTGEPLAVHRNILAVAPRLPIVRTQGELTVYACNPGSWGPPVDQRLPYNFAAVTFATVEVAQDSDSTTIVHTKDTVKLSTMTHRTEARGRLAYGWDHAQSTSHRPRDPRKRETSVSIVESYPQEYGPRTLEELQVATMQILYFIDRGLKLARSEKSKQKPRPESR